MTYLTFIVADCSISIPLVFCGNITKTYACIRGSKRFTHNESSAPKGTLLSFI